MSTPIFASGSWVVVSQTVIRKGEPVEVPCKLVQYAPPVERNDGSQFFPKLGKNAFFQVLVKHTKGGEPLKVKLGRNGFRVAFPDAKRKANWWDDEATIVEKVDPTPWMGLQEALRYLNGRFNPDITEFIVELLIKTQQEAMAAKAA